MYDFLYHSLLARTDAEQSHRLVLQLLRVVGNVPVAHSSLKRLTATNTAGMSINALGLSFQHPLGLAAGFDKDATCLDGLSALGFGFIELGSITPRPQHGNDGKRIIRLLDQNALINRMGFPSLGAERVEQQLRSVRRYKSPLGISLGINKTTPLTDAANDYSATLDKLYTYGDFFVINISSPNTANLRTLQTAEYLGNLLVTVRQYLDTLANGQQTKPLLIKIAADLTWQQIDNLLELCVTHGIDGIVATNTLPVIHNEVYAIGGGLSGQPLRERSTEIIHYIHQRTQGKLCIIGVGGVFSGDDVWDKLAAGASLVQSYTGFIYRGPFFVKKALRELRQRMDREGVQNLCEIIGTA